MREVEGSLRVETLSKMFRTGTGAMNVTIIYNALKSDNFLSIPELQRMELGMKNADMIKLLINVLKEAHYVESTFRDNEQVFRVRQA